MEREIKFKAKVIREDKWTFSNGFLKFADGTITIIVEDNGDHCKTSPIQEGTLRQFTGFKDDNDIEIYEGDNLNFGAQLGSKSEVKWIEKNGAFLVKDKYNYWHWLYNIVASTKCIVEDTNKVLFEEAGEIDKEAYSKLSKRNIIDPDKLK